jgi:hypothetical protein
MKSRSPTPKGLSSLSIKNQIEFFDVPLVQAIQEKQHRTRHSGKDIKQKTPIICQKIGTAHRTLSIIFVAEALVYLSCFNDRSSISFMTIIITAKPSF